MRPDPRGARAGVRTLLPVAPGTPPGRGRRRARPGRGPSDRDRLRGFDPCRERARGGIALRDPVARVARSRRSTRAGYPHARDASSLARRRQRELNGEWPEAASPRAILIIGIIPWRPRAP